MHVSWGETKRRKMSQPAVGVRRVSVIAVVQLLSHVQRFVSPQIAAFQVSVSSTISRGLHRFLSTESVMLSNHLIFWHSLFLLPSWLPSIFPSTKVFSNDSASSSQSIGTSASATVLPMNIQDWFSLGWTGWISLYIQHFILFYPMNQVAKVLELQLQQQSFQWIFRIDFL